MRASDHSPGKIGIKKIVVAIHGMGSQRRGDSIRSVADRFGEWRGPEPGKLSRLPVMPLGFFNIGLAGEVHVSRLDTGNDDDPRAEIGFAEVFWADIPRRVVEAADTLEETKAWGASVVSRTRATYVACVGKGRLDEKDFDLAGGVIEEIVESLGVIEKLLAVFEYAGLAKFYVGPLLRDYLGDVQLVTDFAQYRDEILHRFHDAMGQVVARFKEATTSADPEIYIVAHSEGTVISFLGLLQALSGRQPRRRGEEQALSADWIRFVRGFMTLGSPIDKHILLWEKLFDGLVKPGAREAPRFATERPIQWRNYYDYGDPIGFRLESARRLLHDRNCQAFEFEERHDIGFSRYWLPGKAHIDYWKDNAVFGHFIEDVVLPGKPSRSKAPADRLLVGAVSTAIPYVCTWMLHVAAVYLISKAFVASGDTAPFKELALQVVLLSILLLSVTVSARLPRLVKRWGLYGIRWFVLAAGLYGGAASLCWKYLPRDVVEFFDDGVGVFGLEHSGKMALIITGGMVAISGWIAPRRPKYARRMLLGSGLFAAMVIIVSRMLDTEVETWPVLLASVAFLYLWWLGIILFDLTFVWHRYIRESVTVETLRQWRSERKDAEPRLLTTVKRGMKKFRRWGIK